MQISSSMEKEPASLDFLVNNGVAIRLREIYGGFLEKREALGLSNPGTVDNIAKEVQRDVFLNNLSFSGLRADLTKVFSASPLFQVSHALSMGSPALPPYSYAAIYGSPKLFLQANVDSDLSLNGRFNYRWTPGFVSKTSVSISPSQGTMASFDNDYTGADFSASLRAMNPSILDGGLTGIIMGSYLQAITPSLSLGFESVWQRQSLSQGPEIVSSYAARYKGQDWIASALLHAQGGIQGSYWRRLGERVEAGVDINLQFAGIGMNGPGGLMGGQMRKEGVTTIGAKYDFRTMSTFRAQVDSNGRIACLLDKRVAPAVGLTFSGEIDHSKGAAKIGLAVSIEAADEEVMASQGKRSQRNASPILKQPVPTTSTHFIIDQSI